MTEATLQTFSIAIVIVTGVIIMHIIFNIGVEDGDSKPN